MDKGIRQYARQLFATENELRRRGLDPYAGPKGNAVFRKRIIYTLVENFGCTVNAACTHYAEAKNFLEDLNAELVSGLGRAPDKNNGGRKKKVAPTVAPTPELLLSWGNTVGIYEM